MTNEQKYEAIINALGEALVEKNDALYLKDYDIKNLKEKLEAAEKEIAELKENF